MIIFIVLNKNLNLIHVNLIQQTRMSSRPTLCDRGAVSYADLSSFREWWQVAEEEGAIWTKIYYPGTDRIESSGYTLNSQKYELWHEYYESGITKAKGRYNNGLKSGLWEYFYESGCTKEEVEYKDGQRNGWCVEYNDTQCINGVRACYPKAEGYYLNNEKCDDWTVFDHS